MKPRDIFLNSLRRGSTPRPACGSATSIVTVDLMEETGYSFPEAHLDAEMMAGLAEAAHTVIGFDNVMPLFSVWHESSALGCQVDWGEKGRMPDSRGSLYAIDDEIVIPKGLLTHQGCNVPLDALALLAKRHGDEVAIVGKVFGPWTLGYHLFGVEEFLINTILKPDAVKHAMDTLKDVTIDFALAQIESGADALCYADHATRDLCSPESYKTFLLDLHREMVERIPCPLILHICGDTSDRIPYIRETDIPCFHFDSKVPTPVARELAGDNLALMGGTSNIDIVLNGSPEDVERDVMEKIDNHIDIIGPECAVPLNTSYRTMKHHAELVKRCC